MRTLRLKVSWGLAMASPGATLHAGDAVQLHGLVRSANLNGRIGECDKWHPEAGRWSVRLQDGKDVSVLVANLVVVSHHVFFLQTYYAGCHSLKEQSSKQQP